MRESKPWRNLLKKRHIDFDWGLSRFMMKSFMGVVCTIMLYIVYRTTNYQYLETELDSKLYRFYTSKETVSASSSLKGLPRGIIEAKSDLELKPLWSTSSSKSEEGKSNWLTIKRALQLVVEDTDTTNPKDISYVFSGYTPLSIRLIQHAIRSGWRPLEEILKLLPGTHTESKRSAFANDSHTLPHMDKLQDGRRSLVLVVFVGEPLYL